MFNLVNEPHTMPTEQWVGAANAAIAAIRVAGASNVIHVPGNAWTGAHGWNSSYYGTPNAKAMLDIVDPIDNLFFEAHQYLDSDWAAAPISASARRSAGSASPASSRGSAPTTRRGSSASSREETTRRATLRSRTC